MLSVGRQIGIHNRAVLCRHCTWKDLGNKLATTLVRPKWVIGYLYVYCCPVCWSLDLAYEGKILPFRSCAEVEQGAPETVTSTQTQESHSGHKQEKK